MNKDATDMCFAQFTDWPKEAIRDVYTVLKAQADYASAPEGKSPTVEFRYPALAKVYKTVVADFMKGLAGFKMKYGYNFSGAQLIDDDWFDSGAFEQSIHSPDAAWTRRVVITNAEESECTSEASTFLRDLLYAVADHYQIPWNKAASIEACFASFENRTNDHWMYRVWRNGWSYNTEIPDIQIQRVVRHALVNFDKESPAMQHHIGCMTKNELTTLFDIAAICSRAPGDHDELKTGIVNAKSLLRYPETYEILKDCVADL